MYTDREEIYGIEFTSDLEKIKAKYKDLEHLGGTVKYLQIKGGNEEFYDKYGPKILKRVIESILKSLISDTDSQLFFYDVINRQGEIYALSRNKIELDKVFVYDINESPLEVELEISELELE